MTEFTKTSNQVTSLGESIAALARALESGSSDAEIVELVRTCETQIDGELGAKIAKFAQKAAEPDPEKRIYGAAMVTKIQQLTEQFTDLKARFDELRPQAKQRAETAERLQRQREVEEEAARRAAAEEAARNAAQEEERRRAAAATAAEAAREEAARRRAEEERILAEVQREAEARAKAREAEAAKKAQEEAEARARHLAEEATQAAEAAKRHAEAMPGSTATRTQPATSGPAAAAAITSVLRGAPAAAPTGPSVSSSAAFPPGQVHSISSPQQFQEALTVAQTRPVFVDWYTTWCGPCQMIAPHIAHLATVHHDVLFLKVDCERVPQLALSKAIRSYPTFHIYLRGAQLIAFSGAHPGRIDAAIAEAQSKAEEAALEDALRESMNDGPAQPAAPPAPAVSAPAAGAGAGTSHTAVSGVSSTPAAGPAVTSIRPSALDRSLQLSQADDRDDLHSALDASFYPLDCTGVKPVSSVAYRASKAVAGFRAVVPPAEWEGSRAAMERIFQNLVDSPANEAYKTIRISNATFTSKVGKFGEPAFEVLRCGGWVQGTRASDGAAVFEYRVASSGLSSADDARVRAVLQHLRI